MSLMLVFSVLVYSILEPITVGAVTQSSSAVITLNVTTGIAISSPGNSTMSTSLGAAQNSAVGTTTWNVSTNNLIGYNLTLNATSAPAMQLASTTASSTIPDYQTGAPNLWSVASGNSAFGYSVFGTDSPTGTWGTGAACSGVNANATSTTLKYKGFTTSPVLVANRSATTTIAGVNTTVCYAVEQNGVYIPSGTYQATIVATATTL